MTHASDVAAELRSRLGSSLGRAKLHKLLYLCQAWHATWTSKPLFVESIEAWDNGPVVADLWRAEQHGYELPRAGAELEPEARAAIDYVISRYGHLTGGQLINLTHEQGPWKRAYDICRNTTLSLEDMVGHFSDDDAADQAWFWLPEWQEGEREADQDIRHGRTTMYDSADEFLSSL